MINLESNSIVHKLDCSNMRTRRIIINEFDKCGTEGLIVVNYNSTMIIVMVVIANYNNWRKSLARNLGNDWCGCICSTTCNIMVLNKWEICNLEYILRSSNVITSPFIILIDHTRLIEYCFSTVIRTGKQLFLIS